MRYTIKWRFLLKLTVVLLIAGTAVFFVHRRQADKLVAALLHQADLAKEDAEKAQKAGKTELAIAEREEEVRFLRRYVVASPGDIDTRERLGRLLVETAKNRKQLDAAYYFLEDVLRRDDKRDELRRFTIGLAFAMRYYKEARGHLEILDNVQPGKPPTNGELAELWAQCHEKEKSYPKAIEGYQAAIKSRTDLPGAYYNLANLQRRELREEKKANDTIDDMLKYNPKNFRAHLFAAEYWREYGMPKEAADEVAKARRLAPDERDVLITAANVALAQARAPGPDGKPQSKEKVAEHIENARQLLTRAIAKDDARKVPGLYLTLASLEAEERHLPEAIQVIQKGLAESPDSSDLLRRLLDYQYQASDRRGMEDTLEKLKTKGKEVSQAVIDYHTAQALALDEKWKDAASLLVRAIPALAGIPAPPGSPLPPPQANLLLARCYEELGDQAKRLTAYTAVLERPTPLARTDALWLPAKLGVAETHTAIGQLPEALTVYREIATTYPGFWVQIARLEMLRTLSQEKRDWRPVEDALAKAEQAAKQNYLPDDLELQLARVAVLRNQGKQSDARSLLEALCKSRPNERAVWIELAFQDAQDEKEKGAQRGLATLDAAEKEWGVRQLVLAPAFVALAMPQAAKEWRESFDSPQLRLARAALLLQTKAADAPAKIAALAAGVDVFDARQRRQLLHGLAEVASQAGDDKVASRLWGDFAKAKPLDLSAQLGQFDVASRSGNVDAMKVARDQIAAIDGDNGQTTRLVRALVLIQESIAAKNRADRDKALAILEQLDREKVGSPLREQVLMNEGRIHEMNDNFTAAIEKYEELTRGAVPYLPAADRLLMLYDRRGYVGGDPESAVALIKKLGGVGKLSENALRSAAVAFLSVGDSSKAMEIARNTVKPESTDYRGQIWLGRMYTASKDENERAKAEGQFREAVRLNPDAMDAWLILIEYLVATGRREEAEKTFDQAKDKVKPADQRFFLALGHIALGQIEKATETYKEARTQNPPDLRILMGEAQFLFQIGKYSEASKAYERVIDLPSATDTDRRAAKHGRALATALNPDNNYTQSLEAINYLGVRPGDPPDPNETPAQRRARAVVLAFLKDRPNKLEAIRLLTENPEGRTPGEVFLLAQLHNAVGNRDQVPLVMENLLGVERNRTPQHISYYVNWLVKEAKREKTENTLGAAQRWVAELEKRDPKSLLVAELKTRVAAARGKSAEAREALRPLIDNPKVQVDRLSRFCEDIGLYEEAEQLLKKYIEQQQKARPEVVLDLARYYGRRGNAAMTAKAMQIWSESRNKFAAPLLASVAVDVLYHATKLSPIDSGLAEIADWLKHETEKAKGNDRAALFQHYAAILNLQEKYAESAEVYRSALAENRRDALAMNNLAYLLSADPKQQKHDEALQLISDAKNIIGQTNSDLLDTEALIRINKGEFREARKILEVVAAEAPTGVAFYHLALVENKLNNKQGRQQAWNRAQELGVQSADLHPLDRDLFVELSDKDK